MTTNGDDWLTVRQAVKLSGYNPESLTRLIREGKIKARKISIIWLVDRASLSKYLDKVQTLGGKRGRKPEN